MEKLDCRKAYGQALLELGKVNDKVVALEADLGKSTMSNMFGDEFPERYFQMGIAEQNMGSTSAGLALTGKIDPCLLQNTEFFHILVKSLSAQA